MSPPGSIGSFLETLLGTDPPRAGSLAITIFGDVISQQGGSVWLGSLVSAMAEFGLNERQVRTALFRLVKDDWLTTEQKGRRSYYALSPTGQRLYARAAARIYAFEHASWDGEWTLVMPGAIAPAAREHLRKRLGWQGFGLLGSGMLAHPRADADALAETLTELDIEAGVVVWRARALADQALRELVRSAWQLEDIAARCSAFVKRFEPVVVLLEDGTPCTGRDALVLRCVLIHDYRRILLRTIDLPPELLPSNWPGSIAMHLVRRIYGEVHASASAYASTVLECARGHLPAPAASFHARFGGLPRRPDPTLRRTATSAGRRDGPARETC